MLLLHKLLIVDDDAVVLDVLLGDLSPPLSICLSIYAKSVVTMHATQHVSCEGEMSFVTKTKLLMNKKEPKLGDILGLQRKAAEDISSCNVLSKALRLSLALMIALAWWDPNNNLSPSVVPYSYNFFVDCLESTS